MFPRERRAQEERLREFLASKATHENIGVAVMLTAGALTLAVELANCSGSYDQNAGWLFIKGIFWLALGTGGIWVGKQIAASSRAPTEPKPNPYGSAHWALPDELHAHELKLLGPPQGHGVFLGFDDTTGETLRYQGDNSLITIGPPGSGKLATVIAWNLGLYPGSCIVNDPKGEAAAISAIYRRKFGKVFVLNPFGVLVEQCPFMRSASFNPLAELDPASDEFSSDCTMLAEAIIIQEGKDPHWADGARNLVCGIIGYIVSTEGEPRTLARVNQIINLPDFDDDAPAGTPLNASFRGVMMLMSRHAEDFVKNAARPYLSAKAANEIESILNTARTQLGTFLNAKGIQRALSGNDFRWSDLKKENVTVFIVLPEDKAKAFHRFTRLIYASSLRAMLRFPAKPVYFVMDELATSIGDAQLAAIETAFALGRGFGVRLHAFFQNYAQLKTVFGEKAASLESSAGVVQFFQPSDEETFKKLQSRAGTWTDWVATKSVSEGTSSSTNASGGGSSSTSYSTSTGEQAFKRDLIEPETGYELLGKPTAANAFAAHQIVFFESLASPVWGLRRGYWTDPLMAAMFLPNPYKRG